MIKFIVNQKGWQAFLLIVALPGLVVSFHGSAGLVTLIVLFLFWFVSILLHLTNEETKSKREEIRRKLKAIPLSLFVSTISALLAEYLLNDVMDENTYFRDAKLLCVVAFIIAPLLTLISGMYALITANKLVDYVTAKTDVSRYWLAIYPIWIWLVQDKINDKRVSA